MPFMHDHSYVNFHELNLDYFINELKKNSEDIAKMKEILKEYAEDYIHELLVNGEIEIRFEYNPEFKKLVLVVSTPGE